MPAPGEDGSEHGNDDDEDDHEQKRINLTLFVKRSVFLHFRRTTRLANGRLGRSSVLPLAHAYVNGCYAAFQAKQLQSHRYVNHFSVDLELKIQKSRTFVNLVGKVVDPVSTDFKKGVTAKRVSAVSVYGLEPVEASEQVMGTEANGAQHVQTRKCAK
eukprot:6173930-Pleurochrysis_carterae.AAC.2